MAALQPPRSERKPHCRVALPQLLARVQKQPAAARVAIDGNRESPTHAALSARAETKLDMGRP